MLNNGSRLMLPPDKGVADCDYLFGFCPKVANYLFGFCPKMANYLFGFRLNLLFIYCNTTDYIASLFYFHYNSVILAKKVVSLHLK